MADGGISVRAGSIFGLMGVTINEDKNTHLGGRYSTITVCKKLIKKVLPDEKVEITCHSCLFRISQSLKEEYGETNIPPQQLLLILEG